MTGPHQPALDEVHTITVTCAATGPSLYGIGDDRPTTTLADLEAFTAQLRQLGALDDLPIPRSSRLTVVLDEQPEGTQR